MSQHLNIALAQLNMSVGDIKGNCQKMLDAARSMKGKADLVVFPELSVTGYPPDDLMLRSAFVIEALEAVEALAKASADLPAMLIGAPWQVNGKLYNAAILLSGGQVLDAALKKDLPNYGVFDEKRHFESNSDPRPLDFKGVKLGVMVCEDVWQETVATTLADKGAKILISINASPYVVGKQQLRLALGRKWAHKTGLPFIYVSQVCGQDELVFDGGSYAMGESGQILCELHDFKEHLELLKFTKQDHYWVGAEGKRVSFADKYEQMYSALKLGLHDYVEKNKFPGAIIGMSGGVDSALTAALAVDAIGKERVKLVMLPSPFTSQESLDDARICAESLGVAVETIHITPMMEAYEKALAPHFKGYERDITEENLQSRIRAGVLMAMSNKFGHMLVTTGNKSEMAMGYATLYGDMCGGFNALKDIYKTDVYELCKWRNTQGEVIPENILTKAPTAELRENQRDDDSLPPYDILDEILALLIEERLSSDAIMNKGYEAEIVKRIAKLVKLAEYKRRQAPPGIKITRLAFGRDRRYPITNGFDF